MTTESTERPRDTGARVIGGATVGAFVVAGAVTVLGALVGGSPAAAGAAAGAFALAVVMPFGTYVVHVAARTVPALSLMVALTTYALQIALLLAFFAMLSNAGALDDSVDGAWLVVGVVAGSLTWSATQIWFSARARIPLYDLPDGQTSQPREGSAG